jgi:thiamine kinase-like enzyme
MLADEIVFIPFHTGDTTSLLPTFEGLEQAEIPFKIIPVGQSARHRLPKKWAPFITLPRFIEQGLGRNEQSAESFPESAVQEVVNLSNGAKHVVIGFPSLLQEQIAHALPKNTNKIIYFDCLTFDKEKAARFIPLADTIIVMREDLKQQFEATLEELSPANKPQIFSALHGDFTAWKERFIANNQADSNADIRQQLCLSTEDKLILWAGGYGNVEQTAFKTFITAFKDYKKAFSLRITLHPGIKNISSVEEKLATIQQYYETPLREAGFKDAAITNLITNLETFDVARVSLAVISAGSTVSAQAISIGARAKNVHAAITGVEKVQTLERWHQLLNRWQQKERRALYTTSFRNAQNKMRLPRKSSLHVLKTHFFADTIALCHQRHPEMARIRLICEHFNLGDCEAIGEISQGLTNTVYRLKTTTGNYVLKLIEASSSRARNLADYQTIEAANANYKKRGLSTIAAIEDDKGSYAFPIDDKIALVYPYHAACPLSGPIGPIDSSYAQAVGKLLATIHQLAPETMPAQSMSYDINVETWRTLVAQGVAANASWATTLQNTLEEHCHWLQDYERAYQQLSTNLIFSHGDFCPHNLLDEAGSLRVIDWEMAGLINPQTELMLSLMMCSGFASNDDFNEQIVVDLLSNYLQAGGLPLQDIEAATWGAIGKGWFDWIRFNLSRSLNSTMGSKEQQVFTGNALIALESLGQVMAKKERLISICQQTLDSLEEHSLQPLPSI